MTLEIYLPFLLFVIVMTGTPGMGNLTMMAIGQATGLRSALPFWQAQPLVPSGLIRW